MDISHILFIVLVALQVGDFWSTRRILLAGGHEINPVTRWLIGHAGVEGALSLKTILVLALAWFVLMPYPWIMAMLCIFYGGILWHNWRSL